MSSLKPSRIPLFLTVTALSSACGLVVEIAAGRMVAPYLGMSLYTWTAIIAVVLAGFSLGHWIGGRLADRPTGEAQTAVAWSLVGAAISAVASLILIRVVSGPVIGLEMGAVPTILVLTGLLFFMPSLFVGIPSPVLTKLAIDAAPERTGRTLGTFYAAGAAGSILGTLAAGYIFISWLGTVGTFLMVAGLYLAMAAAIWFATPGRQGLRMSRSELTGLAIVAVAGAAVVLTGAKVRAFTSPCDIESNYYCLRVVDLSADLGVPARELVIDHLSHGGNLETRPDVLINPYAEAFDLLARMHVGQSSPFEAYFIGGGSYTVPRAWLAARPDARLTVAEVDPAVTRIARERLWLGQDDRLTVIHGDARQALQATESRFDVIVGDAFHDIAVPQHLVTREFFEVAAGRLKGGGAFLMNAIDHHDRPRFILSLVASLKGLFPVIEVWRLETSGRRTNFIVAGLSAASPVARFHSRFDGQYVFQRMTNETLTGLARSLDPMVLTDDYAPVDRIIGVE